MKKNVKKKYIPDSTKYENFVPFVFYTIPYKLCATRLVALACDLADAFRFRFSNCIHYKCNRFIGIAFYSIYLNNRIA